MAKFNIDTVEKLLDIISEKHQINFDSTRDRKRLEELFLENSIGITEEYLRKNILNNITRARKKGLSEIGLNQDYLDDLARVGLGMTFHAFEQSLSPIVPAQLKSCFGFWYAYVRESSGRPFILKSPVEIGQYPNRSEVFFKLRGGSGYILEGTLHLVDGCLYTTIINERGKAISIHFKIGKADTPQLLQGVFCGFNSTEMPIGGKELLVRVEDTSFEIMENKKIPIPPTHDSDDDSLNRLTYYFSDLKECNVKIVQINGFDWAALDLP